MALADVLTLLGTDVSSVSVIIVYHLFVIQNWSARVDLLLDEAVRLSWSTTPGDIRRSDLQRRCSELRRRFPARQVLLLGVAVFAMLLAGLVAAAELAPGTWLVSTLPLITLAVVYPVSTVMVLTQGAQTLLDAQSYLDGALRPESRRTRWPPWRRSSTPRDRDLRRR